MFPTGLEIISFKKGHLININIKVVSIHSGVVLSNHSVFDLKVSNVFHSAQHLLKESVKRKRDRNRALL